MKFAELVNNAFYGYMEEDFPSEGLGMNEYELLGHSLLEGDKLAEFLFSELKDTFDPNASEQQQISEAMRAIEMAIRQLESAREAVRWSPTQS